MFTLNAASVMTWLTAAYHENDMMDWNYTKPAFAATCTVLNHNTALDEMESKYAGFEVHIVLSDSSPRHCNITCKERIPMWCYSGSIDIERVTSSNASKFGELDTVALPDQINKCIRNCSTNTLHYRIFAVKPLEFFQREFPLTYPKFRDRMAFVGGKGADMWAKNDEKVQRATYHEWLPVVMDEHPIGSSAPCYILPSPETHPNCELNRNWIEEQDCLANDTHPCRFNQIVWTVPSDLRGRTYFVATWTTLLWIGYVSGCVLWSNTLIDFFAEKYDIIHDRVEKMLTSHDKKSKEGDMSPIDEYKLKALRILLEILKKVKQRCSHVRVFMRWVYWKIVLRGRGSFQIAPIEEFDDFGLEEDEGMEYTSKAMINSGTAFRLLQKAKDEQYEIIDLSGLKIREMPLLLSECKKVKTLILSENELSGECMEVITQTVTLETIHLSKNRITTIPIHNYKAMEKLTLLDLDWNLLGSHGLPLAMGMLSNLKKLFLNNNALTILPECICKMKSLTVLCCNNNEIEEIPSEIGNLCNLVELSLANNLIRQIPVEIKECKKVKYLNLAINEIEYMPEEMGELVDLETLYIGKNEDFKELPLCIDKFVNLKVLDASECRIAAISKKLLFCTSLEQLNLSSNSISYLPVWLNDLSDTLVDFNCTKNHINNMDAQETIARLNGKIKTIKFLP